MLALLVLALLRLLVGLSGSMRTVMGTCIHQRAWLLAPRHSCNIASSVVAQRAQHNRRHAGQVLTGLASEHKRVQLNKSMLKGPGLRCKLLHWQPWLSAVATSRRQAG